MQFVLQAFAMRTTLAIIAGMLTFTTLVYEDTELRDGLNHVGAYIYSMIKSSKARSLDQGASSRL